MKTKPSKEEIKRFLKRAGVSTRSDVGFVTLTNIDHEISFTVPRTVILKLIDTLASFPSDMKVLAGSRLQGIRSYLGPGEALRRYRIKRKISQGQLAERLGIDRSNLVAIERGRRRIGRAMAIKLADALGLDDYRLLM